MRTFIRLAVPAIAVAVIGSTLLSGCAKKVQVAIAVEPPPPPPPPPPPAPDPPKRIVLPGELEFAVAKADINMTPQSTALLQQLADILTNTPRITKLRIEGYTDNTGVAAKNQKLSEDRAAAVAAWLGDHGIDKNRLTTVGYGQTRPITDNDTPEHRMMNRRTEFHVQEIDGKQVPDDAPPAPPQK
jgi:OOP family OmpA-OmpF porin